MPDFRRAGERIRWVGASGGTRPHVEGDDVARKWRRKGIPAAGDRRPGLRVGEAPRQVSGIPRRVGADSGPFVGNAYGFRAVAGPNRRCVKLLSKFFGCVNRTPVGSNVGVPPKSRIYSAGSVHRARFVRSFRPVSTSHRYLWRARQYWAALLITLAIAESAQGATRWATLEAIHYIENPNNLTRPGPRGELGPYQFRAMTWRMHTSTPFVRAIDRETADEVAVRHYEWIKRGLESARMPANAYTIALAWNGGLSAAVAGKSPRAAHDYAQRAANLAADIDGKRNPVVATMTPNLR